MRSKVILLVCTVLVSPHRAAAQTHEARQHGAHGQDSAFAAMQARGRDAMGVDQYTSLHRFDALRDGGRIELRRDRDDSVGTAVIREHMRAIARAFASGDFTTPAMVHLQTVPGADVMRERRRAIRYESIDLPRGAALRIRSSDPVAVAAIHRFLAFQRREHRAPGTPSSSP
jgi:hypothetical protein